MSALEQRRGKATAAAAAGVRGSLSPAHSGSDDDDDAQPNSNYNSDSDNGANNARRADKRKGRASGGGGGGLSTKAALDFVQLLVFVAVMLQALTLFVSYHSLLAGQHAAKVDAGLEASVAALVQAQARMEARIEQIAVAASITKAPAPAAAAHQPATPTLVPAAHIPAESAVPRRKPTVAAPVPAAASAATTKPTEETELVETDSAVATGATTSAEEAEAAQDEEEEVEIVDVAALYKDATGAIDHAKLDRLLEEVQRMRLESLGVDAGAGEAALDELDRPLYSGAVDALGGNRMMQLTPRDLAQLRPSRGEGRTDALLRSLGQLSPAGLPKDIAVVSSPSNPSERHVVAARAIRAGEYFFRIPQRQLLTSLVAEESPLGQMLHQSEIEIDELVFTAVFVLWVKLFGTNNTASSSSSGSSGSSGFREWVDALPLDYSFMAASMPSTPDSLGLIAGTMAAEQTREYQLLFRTEYLTLCHALAAVDWGQRVSLAQWVWARVAVVSRAFGIDVHRIKRDANGQPVRAGGQAETEAEAEADSVEYELESLHLTAMCAGDLLNHEGETRKIDAIWGWNQATAEFAFKASRDIPKGAVIHTTYGPRGNTDLFTHYGFTLEHNPFNYGPLCVVLGRDEARSDRGRVLREAFGRSGEGGAAKWLTSCGGDADSPVAAAAVAAAESNNDAHSVFRCRLHQDLLDEQSIECFALLRALLASDASWSQVVSPRIAADSAARSAHKAAAGDEDDLPAASVAALDAIDWNNEREVIRRIGEHAARSLALIAGGPLSNDTVIVAAHAEAKASGRCTGDASSHPAAWFPAGPCLSGNQWNLIQVRLGEKVPLQNAVDLAAAVSRFESAAPTSLADAYAFLDSLVPSDAELARLAAVDATPNWSLLAYFNEALLPVYARSQGWTDAAGFAGENARLYSAYRRRYQPLSKEEMEEQEHRLHSFGYGEDGDE